MATAAEPGCLRWPRRPAGATPAAEGFSPALPDKVQTGRSFHPDFSIRIKMSVSPSPSKLYPETQ